MTQACLPAEFDPESLRIAYPFTQVPAEDVATIRGDPDFFGGYFLPISAAHVTEPMCDKCKGALCLFR